MGATTASDAREIGGMSERMTLVGMIADHPTPKINLDGVAYTVNSRDYKGVMVVVVQRNNNNHDEYLPGGEHGSNYPTITEQRFS